DAEIDAPVRAGQSEERAGVRRGDGRENCDLRRLDHHLFDLEVRVWERRVEGAISFLDRGSPDERSVHRALDDPVERVEGSQPLGIAPTLAYDEAVEHRPQI